jgi:hypothetical protein
MFKPIIHNLEPTDPCFKAIQHYNKLIGNKKLSGFNLKEKIEYERLYIKSCKDAYEYAYRLINENCT